MSNVGIVANSQWSLLKRASLILLIFCAGTSPAWAAYCSLRDPISAIHTLFPDASQHRSIVSAIGNNERNQIAERLPFTLHFNELGRHTLFVAQQGEIPLGFVHARSESSEWGLIEIAWGVTLDLKIEGFYFQRCRSSKCNDELLQDVSADLKGKTLDEIRMLLSPDGSTLVESMASKYNKNRTLVLSIIRSALKTVATTEYGWAEDISLLQRRAFAMQGLGSSRAIDLLPITRDELEEQSVLADFAPVYAFVDKPSLKAFRVMENDIEVARLVDATWKFKGQSGSFSWLFARSGEVLSIKNHNPMPDSDTDLAFSRLRGKNLSDPKNCEDGAALAGNAIYLSAYKALKVTQREN